MSLSKPTRLLVFASRQANQRRAICGKGWPARAFSVRLSRQHSIPANDALGRAFDLENLAIFDGVMAYCGQLHEEITLWQQLWKQSRRR